MSFLDAISKVEKKEEAVEVNPLLKGKAQVAAPKKPNPFSKPSPFIKDPSAKEAPTAPAAPSPIKPVFKAPAELTSEVKAKEAEVTEAKVEVSDSETPEEILEIDNQAEETNTVEIQEVADSEVEEKEAILKDSEQEETKEEIKEEIKEAPKKRTRKTKTAPKENSSENTTSDPIQMFSTEISYEEAIANISSPFINEEFEALKQEIVNEMNSIEISADMNSITAKEVNSKLASLYQKIWFENQAAKALYDQLNQKDNGLIDRTRSLFIDGQNDAQRKKSGIEACIKFTSSISDDAINLYEMLDSAREQHYFFKAAMDHLDFKKNIMISMNAALKIEEKVLGHEL